MRPKAWAHPNLLSQFHAMRRDENQSETSRPISSICKQAAAPQTARLWQATAADAFVRIAVGAQQHPRGGIWHCSRPTALSRPMLTVPEPPPRPAAPNARAPCRWTARGCGSCLPAHALLPMALQQRRRRRPTSNHAVGATLRPRDAPAASPSRDFYFYCRRRRRGERGLIQNGICCAGVSRAAAEKCAHGMQ
jgi:hypothetical protein